MSGQKHPQCLGPDGQPNPVCALTLGHLKESLDEHKALTSARLDVIHAAVKDLDKHMRNGVTTEITTLKTMQKVQWWMISGTAASLGGLAIAAVWLIFMGK